nr:uncharacterized protein LOC108007990 [Drosophila suzukii]
MCDKKTGLIYIKSLISLALMAMAGWDIIYIIAPQVNLSVFIYLILNYPKLNILDWHDHHKWTYSSGVIAWSDIQWILHLFGLGFIPFAIVIFYIWNRHEFRERGYLD